MTALRRQRLGEALLDRGVEMLLVTTLVNVRYLTGFTGSNGAVLVSAGGGAVFLTDGRYQDQAGAEVPDLEHVITRDLVGEAARRVDVADLGIESHTLSVDAHTRLTELLPSTTVQGTGRVVESLREVKDDDEINALTRACDISTRALTALLEGSLVGRTEREVARDLENRMLDDAGWLERFATGLGHGVGLEIHEDPFIGLRNTGKLASRTVLTMEPGIYLPGRGGVRIKDTVLVTTGAPEVLTTMTKDLLEIG